MEFFRRVHRDQQSESYIECETWLFYWMFCIMLQFSNTLFWKLNICHPQVRRVAFG